MIKLYYTINTSQLNDFGEKNLPINQDANLNFFIKDADSLSANVFAKISAVKNNYILSLAPALINEEAILQPLLPKLYLLISLNIRSEEIIIPVIFGHSDERKFINVSVITSYFERQGIKNIKTPFFYYSKNEIIQNAEDCSLIIYPSGPEKDAVFLNAFKAMENKLSTLVIIEFEENIKKLLSFNDTVAHINSLLQNGINVFPDKVSELFVEKWVYEGERHRWKKRTELYQEFLALSKTVQEKEYYDVLNWYHNEYEILPLWYKRLGHLIKVIMGKRTFKSLFDDKVKKYKD